MVELAEGAFWSRNLSTGIWHWGIFQLLDLTWRVYFVFGYMFSAGSELGL